MQLENCVEICQQIWDHGFLIHLEKVTVTQCHNSKSSKAFANAFCCLGPVLNLFRKIYIQNHTIRNVSGKFQRILSQIATVYRHFRNNEFFVYQYIYTAYLSLPLNSSNKQKYGVDVPTHSTHQPNRA